MSGQPRLSGAALLDALEAGTVRVAQPDGAGGWRVNDWVKQEILAIFRSSPLAVFDTGLGSFVDKEALPVRRFGEADGVRLVPGGSAVRRGAFVGRGAVLMPPCYVNVGAWVGEEAMVDSHALIGSCAQVGARVHVSAGAQLGGVLEPVGSRPVIVEEDCLVGGQAGLYEGVLVRRRAVIGAGCLLTASTRLYDLVHEREVEPVDGALEVPADAVVVPGARPASPDWARARDLALSCALIVKYRDAATDARAALEGSLR